MSDTGAVSRCFRPRFVGQGITVCVTKLEKQSLIEDRGTDRVTTPTHFGLRRWPRIADDVTVRTYYYGRYCSRY